MPKVDGLTVTFEEHEVAECIRHARFEHDRATRNGWHGVGFTPKGGILQRYFIRIMSTAAEKAFSILMGVPWKPQKNGFNSPDVAGFQVRCSTDPHRYGLRMTKKDKELVPVAFIKSHTWLRFTLEGMMPGWMPKEIKSIGLSKPAMGTDGAYKIPLKFVRPYRTYKKES